MRHERPRTVLVVDDDSDMRLYCAKALESEGYRTRLSSNATGVGSARPPVGRSSPDRFLIGAFGASNGGLQSKPALTVIILIERAMLLFQSARSLHFHLRRSARSGTRLRCGQTSPLAKRFSPSRCVG
jgi:hypothetical protein